MVISGPLYDISMKYIIEQIKKVPSIVSTWADTNTDNIKVLREYAVDVVLNTKPLYNGIQNVNYANKNITNGILRAKDLGYTHVFTYRTDQYSPELPQLYRIFSNESSTSLVGLCWYNHLSTIAPYGYIMDHMLYGPVDIVYKYRGSYQTPGDTRFTEAFLQEEYFAKSHVSYSDTNTTFRYVLDKIIGAGIEVFCTHHNTEQGDIIKCYRRGPTSFICNPEPTTTVDNTPFV